MAEAIEITVARNTARLDGLQAEVTDFKGSMRDDLAEIKGDVKDVRGSQRTIIISFLGAALAFATLAVTIVLTVQPGG